MCTRRSEEMAKRVAEVLAEQAWGPLPSVEDWYDDAVAHLSAAGMPGIASMVAQYPCRDALSIARTQATARRELRGGAFRVEADMAISVIDRLLEVVS